MQTNNAPLVSIGDFAGYVEYVGKARYRQDSEKRWRLMQISDGLGRRDVELLDRMQIELYRPMQRSLRLVARKALSQAQRRNPVRPVREKVEQLFPGYAFLTFVETDERWREVFKMVGIRGLVCAGNQPVEVPWKMIEEIRAKEVDGAIPSTTKLSAFPFVMGEAVRVSDGPLASFRGVITGLPRNTDKADFSDLTLDELDESFRVKLLVDIFGRQTPVELGLSQIEKLQERA